jgi:hypothetical protein
MKGAYRQLSCGGCGQSHVDRRVTPTVRKTCSRCAAAFLGITQQKFCGDPCRIAAGNDLAKTRDTRACETCGTAFGTFKRNVERRWCGEECKPKALRGLFSCLHCGVEYRKKLSRPGEGETFCSRDCYFASLAAVKQPEWVGKVYAYYAGLCEGCGRAGGKRQPWTHCAECRQDRLKARARDAARDAAMALHKAAARETCCDECGAVFCSLYGSSNAELCTPCADVRLRRHKAAAKALRKAIKRGAPTGERVSDLTILKRDGWRCRCCGIATPEALKGLHVHNAPEVDHDVPVTRGGPHVASNLQCLCRSCNGLKSNRTMEEFHAWLAGEKAPA